MSYNRRHRRPLHDHIHTERDEDMFRSPNPKRFYRSRTDKVWLGVCGGLAERFGWEPVLVRILFVLGIFHGRRTVHYLRLHHHRDDHAKGTDSGALIWPQKRSSFGAMCQTGHV